MHTVLGATGGAGSAITRALLDTGLPVRAVSRSGRAPVGAIGVPADLTHPDGLDMAIAGSAVVYMAAQPAYDRWSAEFPSMLAGVVDAAARHGSKLVMVDNLYAYGPVDGPMTETTPEAATDAKGRVRMAMTESLLDAHRRGDVRVAIGRAADYFGPGAHNSGITALAVAPVLAGKDSAAWLGSLDQPHSAAYTPDVARAWVTLGTDERADGRIWHLPHAPAVTGREFIGLVAEAAGRTLKARAVSKRMLRLAAPFHSISRESLEVVHQWDRPFVVDDTAFQSTFGPAPATPLREAIRHTLDHEMEPA